MVDRQTARREKRQTRPACGEDGGAFQGSRCLVVGHAGGLDLLDATGTAIRAYHV